MKNYPIIILILIAVVAVGWRISHPPRSPIPGPLGTLPKWSSSNVVGSFVGFQFNKTLDKVAFAWVNKDKGGKAESAVHIVDLIGLSHKSFVLPPDYETIAINWNANQVLVLSKTPSGKVDLSEYDTHSQLLSDKTTTMIESTTVLSWPTDSDYFLVRNQEKTGTILSSHNQSGEQFGIPILIPGTSYSTSSNLSVLSVDGNSAVVSLISEHSSFPNYYYCDFMQGNYYLIGSGDAFPGRVLDVFLRKDSVLAFCLSGEDIVAVYYDIHSNTLQPVDDSTVNWSPTDVWEGLSDQPVFFTAEKAIQFELSTLSNKILFSLPNNTPNDLGLRVKLRGAKGIMLKDGNLLSYIADGSIPDIRIFNKTGDKVTPVLIP